jgi:hypothetical protein
MVFLRLTEPLTVACAPWEQLSTSAPWGARAR